MFDAANILCVGFIAAVLGARSGLSTRPCDLLSSAREMKGAPLISLWGIAYWSEQEQCYNTALVVLAKVFTKQTNRTVTHHASR